MSIGNKSNLTTLPPGRSKANTSRIFLLSLCFALFAVGVALPFGFITNASAAGQRTAKKTAGSTSSAPRKASAPKAAPAKPAVQKVQGPDEYVPGTQVIGEKGITRTTGEIMEAQLKAPPSKRPPMLHEHELPERDDIPQNPNAPAVASFPDPNAATAGANSPVLLNAPQALSTNFDGATLTDTGAFPPDSMGSVGPTQFITFDNGRLRSFTKAGVADGVINADPDVFFASVITPVGGSVVLSFTSDPQIRYDRFTARWFVSIIDVPCTNGTCTTTAPNRWLLAVSDAASNGTISGSTVWTFFQFQADPGTNFLDYPTLGVDVNALYTGGSMFTSAGTFVGTNGYVIQKVSVLGAGPIVVTRFANLAAGAGAGPESPRAPDNFDPGATEGYFVGPDNATFSTIMFRRVTNPGSLTPTISGNIAVTVPTTTSPNTVPHLGNTGGTNGNLDSIDDRFFQVMIRNGRMWSAHNFRVNSSGVASTAAQNRNATRWYEFQNLTTTPTVVQSGTVFDNAATAAAARQYFMPSVTVTGQGHAVIGMTMAGTPVGATPVFVGRLSGDTLGIMSGPPTVAAVTFGTTAAAYNPPSDPGGGGGRRWGDYSFTVVDPLDDMTVWTIQEYNQATNSYATRVAKLLAPPPPPTNTASPNGIQLNNPSTIITVTGSAPAGQGFYDPGANLPPPARPFTHITAVGAGITVNSITYNTPTQVTLNVSTVGSTPGSKTVTITNPDGQTTTVNILVGPTAAKVIEFVANSFNDGRVLLQWKSGYEADNLGYNVYREVGGQRVKVNPQVIAGSALITGNHSALTAGKAYVWTDQAQPGARYYLEDIDLSGKSTLTGPINLTPNFTTAPNAEQSALLNRLGAAQAQMTLGQGSVPAERKAEIAAASGAGAALQIELAGQSAVKLSVKQEGWYRVTRSDLVAAGLSANVDPRNLQLYVDGQAVPMIVNGELNGQFANGSIEFYGVGLNSTATASHVYWLVAGTQPGTRIKATRGAGGQAGLSSFAAVIERKDRTIYFSGLRNGEAENFFGPVVANAAVDQSVTLSNVAATATAPASLDLLLQGVTQSSHQVQVTLNGRAVGTVNFAGQGQGKASFPIAQSQLREGINTIQLIAPASGDISLVDTVRISYQHTLKADSNLVRASVAGGQQITLSGFTANDIRVMDVTNANSPQELTGSILGSKSSASITLTVPGSGARTLLAFTGTRAMAASAKANIPSSWHQEGRQFDYVMVTTQALAASLTPLKTLRESQGMSVAVVDVEDLYDEFSFGNKSPQAIKDFLAFTTTNWRSAPRFVLFAGDSSYDMKNYLGFGDYDLVPSKLFDSFYMEATSDDWYVTFQEGAMPEIAVGRLPVRTAAEASAMVGKIISYENSTPSSSMLLVADLDDGYNFAAVEPDLRALLPAGTQAQTILRGSSDDATVRNQIIAAINQGQRIVNYNGHGSLNQWRGNILTNSDAASMTNSQKLSLFVMMTCLNGYFNDPALDSLAESVMKSNGGAAAVWASTAMTGPSGQETLNQEMFKAIFGNGLSLGEAINRAKQTVGDADVRRSWILFGDPSMKLK